MAILLITHDLGVVAEIVRPGGRDVRRPGGRARRRSSDVFARAAPPVHRRRCCASIRSSAMRAATRCRRSRAWSPSPARLPAAAAGSPRAAATRSTAATEDAAASIDVGAGQHVAVLSPREIAADGHERATLRDAAEARRCRAAPAVEALTKHFPVERRLLRRTVGHVRAVDGVSFAIRAARRSGWSASPAAASRRSAARILRLIEPTAGSVRFDGSDVSRPRPAARCSAAARDADRLPGLRTRRSTRG